MDLDWLSFGIGSAATIFLYWIEVKYSPFGIFGPNEKSEKIKII
jgi:hypothetical protein